MPRTNRQSEKIPHMKMHNMIDVFGDRINPSTFVANPMTMEVITSHLTVSHCNYYLE